MAHGVLSTENLDYWQRATTQPLPSPDEKSLTHAPPAQRRLISITGIGVERMSGSHPPSQDTFHFPTEDLIVGLSTYEIPLAFQVSGVQGAVSVQLGTWSPNPEPSVVLDRRQEILSTILRGVYPRIRADDGDVTTKPQPQMGYVLGMPSLKGNPKTHDPYPIDRLIRGLGTGTWSLLVLAQPVRERFATELRAAVINEGRAIQAASEVTAAPSPLASQLLALLEISVKELTLGHSLGMWRTAVYLLGDQSTYHRLASLWRAVFSGEDSLPEPLRVIDSGDLARLATAWAMPDASGSPGPGVYHRPFEHQTLLSSRQLARYVHLPNEETSGFAIETVPSFQVAPTGVDRDGGLDLGRVVRRSDPTTIPYRVDMDSLTRHAFVAGVTGSGKSNTMIHLLKQADEQNIPFLVVEPAKTEYRSLINDPDISSQIAVYTVGDETVSPLRLNPFEVPDGTPVSVHLDLLRSVFSASFGMWTPLPQVLEQCLHRIYEDRGWDLTANLNRRLDSDAKKWMASPRLSDLLDKVDEVTQSLGYEQRVTDDIRAALTTRLKSLRAGGKGRMLDVYRSLPFDELLARPTILELEGMGDDDDKAFLIGLIVARIVEFRRAQGPVSGLKHLLVIEEAHRLLANVRSSGNEEQADPRGKAVETFSNLLAEIRSYGQGVIIADQIPLKLAPEVIKNTNLKIAHRVVADDDRRVLAGSMAMNDDQARALSTFRTGEAAVFREGDDAPILVQVPFAKSAMDGGVPSGIEVRTHMTQLENTELGLRSPTPGCAETCGGEWAECFASIPVVEDPAFRRSFARLVLSTIEDAGSLDRRWYEVMAHVNAHRPPGSDSHRYLSCLFVRAARWYAERRGAQAEWSYSDTDRLALLLQRMLLSKARDETSGEERESFRAFARPLHSRDFDPFPLCSQICTQDPPVCLYRHGARDLKDARDLDKEWTAADLDDARTVDRSRRKTWAVCQDAAYLLIEFPEPDMTEDLRNSVGHAARRAALCWGQQMLLDSTKTPRTALRIGQRLLRGGEP